ncbi:hypothetical protein [Aulosira sp. FACHB-615]|uniref:hypothetical protein n=1 Tax=Aulosira sp. FACHB-615 TaxID=2692777 RepID=UPI001684C226|nr:hypothetical protein [Aulosira sp. FACHB-615]MBD2488991.1 hypothetical protein [Aulosira sp. FACHB-615]
MKIHQLSVEQAKRLNLQFLSHLSSGGVGRMSDEEKAITNALTAFEGMHYWLRWEPERAKLYACEFELLQPQLEKWLSEYGDIYLAESDG